jgi:hypothetical protein
VDWKSQAAVPAGAVKAAGLAGAVDGLAAASVIRDRAAVVAVAATRLLKVLLR